MTKHIVRQVPPEQADFSFYFDDDGLTEDETRLEMIDSSRTVTQYTYRAV